MGIFFKDKPIPTPQKETPKAAPTPVVSFGNAPTATIAVSGDNDFLGYLDGKIREANQPGPDFLEFTDAIKALASMPLTEQQKYLATYPTYLSSGVTADKLVESANLYKKVLDDEQQSFEQELQQSRKEGVDDLQQQAQAEQDAIAKLTQEIQDRTVRLQKLQADASQNSVKLQQQEASFKQAVTAKQSEIDNHIKNIQTYLNANVTK